jgi:hypothetical protein
MEDDKLHHLKSLILLLSVGISLTVFTPIFLATVKQITMR